MRIARQTRLLTITGILVCLVSAAAAPTPQNDVESRVNALLSQMTPEEKIGQLQQLDVNAFGNSRTELIELIRKGQLGSCLNVRGAKQTNELQRIAIEQSRLKIPLIFGFDVIHGYRTIFPVPLGEASSWDPASVERSASTAAAEARASGVHWTFAPMVDIARDARWGRIVEGSGEDPYLGAAMASARVRGFQGTDYSKPDKVVACAKHWVAYGAAEGGRDYNTTDMSERTLREVYFPPFKAALDAGVGTFMSAFNDLNGIPATGNHFTLTEVLRDEWKFDGFVVTDYTAVMELMNHRFAANEEQAAQFAFNAGADMEMVSRLYARHVGDLIRSGKVTQQTLDESVRRILRIKFRLGLFDHPYADESREHDVILNATNLSTARQNAARSMVLLKNERDLLPLNKNVKSIAVIGPLADDPRAILGAWAGDGQAADSVTLLGGIKEKVPNARILYAKGIAIEGRGVTGNYDAKPPTAEAAGGTNVASAANMKAARSATTPAGPNSIEEAVRVAREADAIVLAVGETAEMSGEAASRTSLDLPGRQMELIQAIHKLGKPYVVVLMNGRPLTINWMAENSPAILETWFAGTRGGPAIADVLFGDTNPGGKLPVSFPRTIGEVPFYYNHMSTGRPPTDQKYTSKYLDVPVGPLYPFGYGLSYTQFKFGKPQLSANEIRPDGQLNVEVEVENTGKRAGDEVVQLYIRDQASTVTRPVKELKGFQRITLQPGEKRKVQFVLKPEHLGFLDQNMRFIVEPGEFKVMVGPNSEDVQEVSFQVTGG